ncbi:MAG: hypothetical protein AAF517_27340 [Planctomycetota bacterium]
MGTYLWFLLLVLFVLVPLKSESADLFVGLPLLAFLFVIICARALYFFVNLS